MIVERQALQEQGGVKSPKNIFSILASWRGLLILSTIVGAVIRLYFYGKHTSLWFDEVALALNVAGRSYSSLFHPLWLQQSAPLLYLWIEHSLVLLFGINEWTLRIPSLLCGLGVLFLLSRLTGRLFPGKTAALAVLLAATSSNLIRYSYEVKPYSEDALVSLALVLLAVGCLGEAPRWRKAALLVSGCVVPWVSIPAIFIVAGVGAALLLKSMRQKGSLQSEGWIVLFLLLSSASFAVAYKLVYAITAADPYMKDFWANVVIRFSWPVKRIVLAGWDAAVEPPFGRVGFLPKRFLIVLFPFMLAGVRGAWLRGGLPLVTLLVSPVLFAWGAACLGLWILSPRLMLFYAPLAIFLVAIGATQLSTLVPRTMQNAAFACLALLAMVQSVRNLQWDFTVPELQSNRQLVAATLQTARPGDTIYIYSRAAAAWLFYSFPWAHTDESSLAKRVDEVEQLGPNSGNSAPRGRPVFQEGFSWQYHRQNHTELLGIATGIQNVPYGSIGAVDTGFAENETERIEAAGSDRVLLVASEYHPEPIEAILEKLRQKGFACREFFYGPTTAGFELNKTSVPAASLPVCKVP